MKKAGYYVRVSTGRQEKEATKESQIDELVRRIEADGNILLPQNRFVDNGWTGELLARPALDMMRDASRRGDFDILYVYDRGRIARKFSYQELVLEELSDLNIDFFTLHDINAENPEEKVLQSMQGVFHEYERIKIAERMRRGKLYKTRSGNLLGYNPPYGYDYTPKSGTENGYFTINAEEAEVVKKIFNWVGNEEYTIRKVVKALYEEGILPKKEKKEYWVKSVVDRMVRNRTYIGEHHYNKTEAVVPKKSLNNQKYKKVKRCSRKMKPKEEWIKCKVPAIISQELFDKAQEQLRRNAKFASRNKKHNYLLGGLAYCPCGMKRVGQPGGSHHYYRCSERIYKYPLKTECGEKALNASVLDSIVWEKLSAFLTNKELIKKQAQKWLNTRQAQAPSNNNELDKIKLNLKKLSEEEENYLKAFGQGLVSPDVYERRIKDVNRRRADLMKQLEEERLKQSKQVEIPSVGINELCEQALEIINNFDFEDKLYLIRKLVNKVVGNQEFALVTGHIPITNKEENVSFTPIHRNCRFAKCWQKHAF